MVLSQNGWVANDISLTDNYTIGNGRVVRLRRGDAGYLLKHFADWFDKTVEDVDQGRDDWGYAERNIRGSETTVSNHASGTALDLNATKHPLGQRGTFSATKTKAIRERLKLYGGVIRWGGDYVNRADEMHFEINANAAAVGKVATTIRSAAKEQPVATSPFAHRHLVANWRNNDQVDLQDVSAVQKLEKAPYSAAADDLHTAINAAMRAYLAATD